MALAWEDEAQRMVVGQQQNTDDVRGGMIAVRALEMMGSDVVGQGFRLCQPS
jgi:hypothetical protein